MIADDVRAAAVRHHLDPAVVLAIVSVESSGHPWAWNPEPRYRYFWDVRAWRPFRSVTPAEIASEYPPADFRAIAGDPDQEWWAQQASWGVMQVMGAVAREAGFRHAYLPELCDPWTGLEYGCTHFAGQLIWSGGDVARALGAYNAGRGGADGPAGQAYAARVLARVGRSL